MRVIIENVQICLGISQSDGILISWIPSFKFFDSNAKSCFWLMDTKLELVDEFLFKHATIWTVVHIDEYDDGEIFSVRIAIGSQF